MPIPRRTALWTALALAVAACAPAPAPAPKTDVAISFTASGNMNGGAPAQAKVYYLTAPGTFQAADFFAVFQQPEATLGAELVAVDDFQLSPGQGATGSRSFDIPPVAVGVVVAFRDIGNARFSAVRPLTPGTLNPVAISVSGNSVSIR